MMKSSTHKWSWQDGKLHTTLDDGTNWDISRDISDLDQFVVMNNSNLDRESDLVDIATAIYGSDRLAGRPGGFSGGELEWRRHISVSIPVRQPDYWKQPQIKHFLQEVLGELSDDIWKLSFRGEASRRAVTRRAMPPTRPPRIALFSGGLDSLAGTLSLLTSDSAPIGLVSFDSCGSNKGFQSKVGALLLQKFSNAVAITPYRMHFNHTSPDSDNQLREQARRQRARSFLYFVVAAVLARRVNQSQVFVLENGVTSLNLPINPLLSSSRVTRTTHPLVLLACERLFRQVLEWPEFELRLPHFLQTKSEMVAPFASEYRDVIAATVSCARFMNNAICGTCTACLLRRQVFWLNGLDDIDIQEQRNAKRDILADFYEKRDERAWYFLASVDNAMRLRADPSIVTHDASILRTAVDWSTRHGGTSKKQIDELIRLHGRYADEWHQFLSRAKNHYPALKSLGV